MQFLPGYALLHAIIISGICDKSEENKSQRRITDIYYRKFFMYLYERCTHLHKLA